MGRPRCDPFDPPVIIAELEAGRTTPLKAYHDYASVAARPYARATFELLIAKARRETSVERAPPTIVVPNSPPSLAEQDDASDAFWTYHLPVKARVLTTMSDNTSLRVKGGALIVHDGERRLVFEGSAPKPRAIVMCGWSGMVTVEAMRFVCDHKMALVLLDWSREFLNIVSAPAKTSAELIRCQVSADPIAVAQAIVAQKIAAVDFH